MKYRLLLFLLAAALQSLAAQGTTPPGPVPVILDTDMSSDCDDAGALALLNSFMNRGETVLLACIANGRDRDLCSGAAIRAINAYYGHAAIPIGAYHGEAGATQSHYTKQVHERFDPEFPADDRLPAGVDLYRRTLASAADGSAVIVSVGFLQNLRDLLQSKPDTASDLDGLGLVQRKVRELVIMGENFPKSANDFNLGLHGLGPVSEEVVSHWPTPILFSPGNIGSGISTGKALAATPEGNPVRFIYGLFGDGTHTALRDGRPSWDLTAAWLGVRGPQDLWDVVDGGFFQVDPKTGGGEWIADPAKHHAYIVVKMPPAEVQKRLEAELVRPPSG